MLGLSIQRSTLPGPPHVAPTRLAKLRGLSLLEGMFRCFEDISIKQQLLNCFWKRLPALPYSMSMVQLIVRWEQIVNTPCW